ncbi:MAG TPA: hypothetical protein VLO09_01270, partial [Ornithinimicrobium sp.]|nr:hypothetical protein [Ornithinimicrobium sp.]
MNRARRAARHTRDRLLPLARLLPPGRGPAPVRRLGWDGRVESARSRMKSDPAGALAALEQDLGPQAPPRVWRTAAQAAARAKQHARVVELDRRAVEEGYAGIGDVLRLRKAAVAVGDEDAVQMAEDHLLGLTPVRAGAVRQSVPVLAQLDPSRLPAVKAWRDRAARSQPGLDLTPVDEALAQVRLRGELADGQISEETVQRALADPGELSGLVRTLTSNRMFDDLEAMVVRLTPLKAATVPTGVWRNVARRAISSGWNELAGRAAALVLAAGPEDGEGDQDGPWLRDLVDQ